MKVKVKTELNSEQYHKFDKRYEGPAPGPYVLFWGVMLSSTRPITMYSCFKFGTARYRFSGTLYSTNYQTNREHITIENN